MTLKIGDRIAEYGYGRKISSTVKTTPKQEGSQITFEAETDNGHKIKYLMTVSHPAYSPDIYLENGEAD